MPKKKPENEKRVPFNCLISPATLTAINETVKADKISQGAVVDRAVALLVYGEDVNQSRTIADAIQEETNKASRELNRNPIVIPPHAVSSNWRDGRKPLLKPGEKG